MSVLTNVKNKMLYLCDWRMVYGGGGEGGMTILHYCQDHFQPALPGVQYNRETTLLLPENLFHCLITV